MNLERHTLHFLECLPPHYRQNLQTPLKSTQSKRKFYFLDRQRLIHSLKRACHLLVLRTHFRSTPHTTRLLLCVASAHSNPHTNTPPQLAAMRAFLDIDIGDRAEFERESAAFERAAAFLAAVGAPQLGLPGR